MADSLDQKVLERAQAFAGDIAALVKQSIAEEVFRLVGGGERKAASNGPRPKAGKSRLARSRAASKRISDEQVLGAIRGKKAGALAREIAQATGLQMGSLSYRLGKLKAAKKLRTTGKTSKTRYFVVG